MSYSTDPIKDAYRHTEKVDAETMALEMITRHYSSVINGVLTKKMFFLGAAILHSSDQQF